MMSSLAVGCVIGGILSDKFRKQKLFIIISGIILVIGVSINIFAPSVIYIMISAIFYGFGYGMFLAVDTALIARILPNEKDAAKDFGIMNIANTIPQSIVPFNLSRTIGQTTGAAVIGAIFYLLNKTKAMDSSSPENITAGIHNTFLIAALIMACGLIIGVIALSLKKEQVNG